MTASSANLNVNANVPSKFLSLNKKWKEVVYALSGFGPNLLMVIMGARFMAAVNPLGDALTGDVGIIYTIGRDLAGGISGLSSAVSIVIPIVFIVLFYIGRAFDGFIDIPFANLTDTYKSKWGRRRPLIAMSALPMIGAYIASWLPLFPNIDPIDPSFAHLLTNTIWIFVWSLVFFASYTMCLIGFYGSLSTVCIDESQRRRVTNYKSIFDTIGYAIAYALLPLLISFLVETTPELSFRMNYVILLLVPIMLTIMIPLFIIKEGDKHELKMKKEGVVYTPLEDEPNVKLLDSIVTALKSKPFIAWLAVNCASFIGLQMFLSSMSELLRIVMGMSAFAGINGLGETILNTAAFAPVPLTLFMFNKVIKKKGVRFGVQTSMVAFTIAIMSFFAGSEFFWQDNELPKLIIGLIGAMGSSWAIGSFFMMPYLIPTQIASVEKKLMGKNNAAMYFAVQAFATSVVGAIASVIVWGLIKGIYYDFTTETWYNAAFNGQDLLIKSAIDANHDLLAVGAYTVPFIVALACITAFGLTFLMPKRYNVTTIAKSRNLDVPDDLVETEFVDEDDVEAQGIVGNIMLWFLSVGLFELFWRYSLMKKYFRTKDMSKTVFILIYIASFLLPIVIYGLITVDMTDNISAKLKQLKQPDMLLVTKCFIVILASVGLSLVSNILLQLQLGKIYKYQVAQKDLTAKRTTPLVTD